MRIYKNIKIINICLIVAILINLIIVTNKVEAATFTVTSSKSTVTVGDTFTVTIDGTGLTGKYSITGNSNVTISGDTSPWIENTKATVTCTAKSEGTATVTVTPVTVADSATGVDQSLSAKSVNVTVKAKETTPPPSNGGSTGGNTGGSTGGNTGGGTTTTPTAPKFTDVSKTVYTNTDNVNLRASWSTSSAATTVPKGTELRLTGTSTEKVNGYVWYRVTYNGQIKYVSKDLITETKPEGKSSNANLKTLAIEGVELTPAFSADVTEYSIKLENFEATDINVTAEAEDEKSVVKLVGNTDLKVGENIITVTVTAEDGTTKIYTITAVKEETTAFGLSSLTIKDVELKGFRAEKYDYKVSFEGLDKLEIEAIASEEGATIEILGNENLVEGENLITIIVTSADGSKTATYQIKATKLVATAQEEVKEINMKAILISALIALVVLVIIIILIVKYVKRNSLPVVDYEYHDNLDNKEDKNDTEFAKEIAPETDVVKETKVDDLYEEDVDDMPRRRGKGKHSK